MTKLEMYKKALEQVINGLDEMCELWDEMQNDDINGNSIEFDKILVKDGIMPTFTIDFDELKHELKDYLYSIDD